MRFLIWLITQHFAIRRIARRLPREFFGESGSVQNKVIPMLVQLFVQIHNAYTLTQAKRSEGGPLDEAAWSAVIRLTELMGDNDREPLAPVKKLSTELNGRPWHELHEVERLAVVCAYALTFDRPGLPAFTAQLCSGRGEKRLRFIQAVLNIVDPSLKTLPVKGGDTAAHPAGFQCDCPYCSAAVQLQPSTSGRIPCRCPKCRKDFNVEIE
jgi:hypothetical protein